MPRLPGTRQDAEALLVEAACTLAREAARSKIEKESLIVKEKERRVVVSQLQRMRPPLFI